MARPDSRTRSGLYLIEFERAPVAHVSSVAGLRTALQNSELEGTVVSLAYPRDASWLSAWIEQGDRRRITIVDPNRGEAFVLYVAAISDVSGDASIFELRCVSATRSSDVAGAPPGD